MSGCSSGSASPQQVRTITVAPQQTSSAGTTSASTSASASSSAPAPVAIQQHLGGTCDTLLSRYDVQTALGHSLPGKTAFVVGVPERSIGRLSYLNCRYGVPPVPPGTAAVPLIEIGISLYTTPAQAARRLRGTIEDYVSNGARPTATVVAGHPATMLTGGSGSDYALPILVFASGQRTIAVTLSPNAAPASGRTAMMQTLAKLAVTSTGG